jgi:hypothetical protein
MALDLNAVQRLTIEALRRVQPDYVPPDRRRVLPGRDEFGGELREKDGKYYCEAILSKTQFFQLRDELNAAGVWLALVKFTPYGRTSNKFIYRLLASPLITSAEWMQRRAAQSVRCTVELIHEGDDPSGGLADVMRQLADRLDGCQQQRLQLVVETETTRGRAILRPHGQTIGVEAENAGQDRIAGGRHGDRGAARGAAQVSPDAGGRGLAAEGVLGQPDSPGKDAAGAAVGEPNMEPAAGCRRGAHVAAYGSGRLTGYIVTLPG